MSEVVLFNYPVGPFVHPIFDIWTFEESEKQCCLFHGIRHLFCIDIGDVIEVELISEGVGLGTITIEFTWWVSSKFAIFTSSWSGSTSSWWTCWWEASEASSWWSSPRWVSSSSSSVRPRDEGC